MRPAPGALAPQFEDLEQQRETARLGMWIFLVTELLFFGGLFAAYAIYRSLYPDAFTEASRRLDWKAGAFNTVLLIASSFVVALAVRDAALARARRTAALFGLTALMGIGFLIVKFMEYRHKYAEGLLPFQSREEAATSLFFWLYLIMTGLHAVHVIVGIGLLAWVSAVAARRRLGPDNYAPAEVVGLYWHFVDVVWIFLFPLLYLVGRHS